MSNRLVLKWASGEQHTMVLLPNAMSSHIYKCMKHLQHLPLKFGARENPLLTRDRDRLEKGLIQWCLDNEVDIEHGRLSQQAYLNHLHDIYLDSYSRDPDPAWLQFHDLVHSLEEIETNVRKSIWIDYQHRAGPLVSPMDPGLMRLRANTVLPGDCFVASHELGKTLWTYYRDGEPDDPIRVCRLARPWQWLKPVISVATHEWHSSDSPHLSNPEFRAWRDRHLAHWCAHHSLDDYEPGDEDSRIPIGRLQDAQRVFELFSRGEHPVIMRTE